MGRGGNRRSRKTKKLLKQFNTGQVDGAKATKKIKKKRDKELTYSKMRSS